MKNFLVQAFALLLFIVLFSSCTADEIQPGIIYTDSPPESLFQSTSDYGQTYKCWIDEQSIKEIKSVGETCNNYFNVEKQSFEFFDCGNWKKIPARKYWGIKNGILYLSKSHDWYFMSPNVYGRLRDLIDKKATVIGNLCGQCPTPYGNVMSVNGLE